MVSEAWRSTDARTCARASPTVGVTPRRRLLRRSLPLRVGRWSSAAMIPKRARRAKSDATLLALVLDTLVNRLLVVPAKHSPT